ncbi:hypothetical protein ACW2Q0_16465 [Nocardia sp. R16R-3T]
MTSPFSGMGFRIVRDVFPAPNQAAAAPLGRGAIGAEGHGARDVLGLDRDSAARTSRPCPVHCLGVVGWVGHDAFES